MNSIEDLLNSFFQSSPNTVRAAEGGLMGSPIPNTPMSGGANSPMGATNSPMQNNPMAGGPVGGSQQNSPMSGSQQFGATPPSTTNSSPTSSVPQNTFNPYMGGASQGGVNIFPGPSQGAPTPPGSLGSDEARRQYDLANAKPQSMPYQQSTPQMGGMGPDPNSGIIGLLPRQSPYEQQQQQMGQQFQQQYGSRLAALQDNKRQYDMQQQQMIDEQRKMGGMGQVQPMMDGSMPQPGQFGPRPTQVSDANPNQMLVYNRPAERQRGVGGGQQKVDGRMPGPGDIGPRPTQVLYASPDQPATPGMSRDQMMDAAVRAGRLSGMDSAGPNPYQTATSLNPNDPMLARTRGVSGGQQRMNPFEQLMEKSRGMRAATQPYTPINTRNPNPLTAPQKPTLGSSNLNMPGNFAMPMPKQNNAEDLERMQQQFDESNVSSAGRRRLV